MTWEGWLTLTSVLMMIVGLVRYAHLSDVIFLSGVSILALAGVITPAQALAGFHNEGVVTIASLFIVGAALVETGLLEVVARRVLGSSADLPKALTRLVPATVLGSAFLNNTTVVAMGMPTLVEWARRCAAPVSKLLLPLSFAAILGGVCTLIGTSTNLVVHGLMKQSSVSGLQTGLGMWELGWVGIPIALLGAAYLITFAPRLLRDRRDPVQELGEKRREFLCEARVAAGCPLVGCSIQEAGLRGLPGLFLIEIERDGELLAPVRPEERLRSGDRLVFTGVVSTIVDLQRIPGLEPAADLHYQITERGGTRRLCEAVVSVSSPLVGRGVREARFRELYDAVVVAIHRNSRRLAGKIGDMRLQAGDTLLLQTGSAFATTHRNNPDFYLVSEAGDVAPRRTRRAGMAILIAVTLVFLLSLPEIVRAHSPASAFGGWLESRRALFAMLAAGLMMVTRCVRVTAARRSIDWNVLLTIAAALGVGSAIECSGLAAQIGQAVTRLVQPLGPTGVLAAVYAITWLLTEAISNNAAAALMFPVAIAAAQHVGAEPRPFAIAVAIAASTSFVLPAGYQTHLMVFGPGGYTVGDFLRVGLPMVLLWMSVAVTLIPMVWPLHS